MIAALCPLVFATNLALCLSAKSFTKLNEAPAVVPSITTNYGGGVAHWLRFGDESTTSAQCQAAVCTTNGKDGGKIMYAAYCAGSCSGSGLSGQVCHTYTQYSTSGYGAHGDPMEAAWHCDPNAVLATGDPHLTNLQGKKFDIHDGQHRLVHYPRGAPESEALLKIDADAVMMGETSCYGVFFQSARISGKWVGNDILLNNGLNQTGQRAFSVSMGGRSHLWRALALETSDIMFGGIEPVKMSTSSRAATASLPGGENLEFSIGREDPVLIDVWSSHGSNELTNMEDIHYLNLQLQNLPKNSGGLLGLDSYERPANAKCGLTQDEMRGINSIQDLNLIQLQPTRRLHWSAMASAAIEIH